jgi:hypothetical protein
MKTEHDAVGTVEHEFGHAKRENGTPSLLSKTCPGAQNMKLGPDALATAENEYGDAKQENGTRRPRNHRK